MRVFHAVMGIICATLLLTGLITVLTITNPPFWRGLPLVLATSGCATWAIYKGFKQVIG